MIFSENCKAKATFITENALYRKKSPQAHNFLDILFKFDMLAMEKTEERRVNSRTSFFKLSPLLSIGPLRLSNVLLAVFGCDAG